jgi:hypothetical protein
MHLNGNSSVVHNAKPTGLKREMALVLFYKEQKQIEMLAIEGKGENTAVVEMNPNRNWHESSPEKQVISVPIETT